MCASILNNLSRSTSRVPMPGDRVVVGMSGGVDSSVAALQLRQAGFQVEGLFMKNWEEDDGTEYCTALADLEDARRVAAQLDIPLHTANFAAEYWDNVFEHFLAEYQAGRTPNPDILCNREIKFHQFARYARQLGADWIATGHYARIRHTDNGPELLRAADENKDQTYFLQAVPQQALERCLFPLGELCKPQVRDIAAAAGFHNHRKKDSTGICFIGERRFRDFLRRYLDDQSGPIRDPEGRRIGTHIGLHHYTLGQRQGLGIGGVTGYAEAPWYVQAKERAGNCLRVTQKPEDLDSRWLAAAQWNWLAPEPPPGRTLHGRCRHRQALQPATLQRRADGRYRVIFARPQRALTPGQYVCLYDDDRCLGGGRIEQAGV